MKLHDWVDVLRCDESPLYPGCITQINGDEIEVSVMHKAVGHFKGPTVEDKIFYTQENIVKKISPPIQIGSRGQFTFTEIIYTYKCMCKY